MEWEEKIAAVKEQVSDLVDEEQRILESLSSHRRRPIRQYFGPRVSHNLPPVRHYSTKPSLATDENLPWNDSQPDNHTLPETDNEHLADPAAAVEEELIDDLNQENNSRTANNSAPDWAVNDVLRLQAIQKLAVRQLAIRLLLRPSVAHNYAGTQMNYGVDSSLPQLNIRELFQELNSVRRRMHHLKESKDAYIGDLVQDIPLSQVREAEKQVDQLDTELGRDIGLCFHQKMSVQELLLRISNNLIRSPEPDRPKAFRFMIMGLTKMRQNDVVNLMLKSILPNYFSLKFSLIIAILTHFRKSKDLKNFDLFLQMLRGEGYPANLGKSDFFRTKEVNGVEVTVPPIDNYNLVIYSTLIVSALRFDQPERADAWYQVARNTGFVDSFATLYAYLKFYIIRNDWEKGVNVLRRALAFIVSSENHRPRRVERLVVLMVQLCDANGQGHVSEALISAFVHSGFDRKAPEAQLDCAFPSDPDYNRWKSVPESAGVDRLELPVSAKCFTFASTIGPQADELFGITGPSFSQRKQLLNREFSEGVLSVALNTHLHPKPDPHIGPGAAPKFYYIRRSALAKYGQHNEVKALRSEVEELKEAVAQLKGSISQSV